MRAISIGLVILAGSLLTGAGSSLAQDQGATLIDLAESNPNAYVLGIQQRLVEQGYLTTEPDGVLTAPTIRAINKACDAAGLLQACSAGPLSLSGATAVVAALTPAGSGEGVASLRAEQWFGMERMGVKTEIVSGDGGVVVAHISGTATEANWINLHGPDLPASEGESFTFVVEAEHTAGDSLPLVARMAAFGADNYIGELQPEGASMDGSGPVRVSGTAPAGTVRVVPYLQFSYTAGQQIDDTVTIASGFIASNK